VHKLASHIGKNMSSLGVKSASPGHAKMGTGKKAVRHKYPSRVWPPDMILVSMDLTGEDTRF